MRFLLGNTGVARIFIACFGTETNTFSSMPTGMTTFAETLLYRGDATRHTPTSFSVPLHVWRQRGEERQDQIIEGLSAFAQPSGITTRHVYEELRDELLDDIRSKGPFDIVLLGMHGAMVADGYDDCEGDTIARVREIVGQDTIIGVEFDLHCSVTDTIVNNADVLVIYKEYPHVDIGPRAEELFDICKRAHAGEVRPVMEVHDCRMINMWRTPVEPMKSVVAEMQAAEGQDGILSVSFAHGFPWGDVPAASAKMLVISDNDPEKAAAAAQHFAKRIWDLRGETSPDLLTISQALDLVSEDDSGLLVLADIADNAGGGAPSDSTFILAEVLKRGVKGVLSGFYWDPIAVRFCEEAGEGAQFDLRLGGKCGPTSGDPIDIRVTVKRVLEDARQTYGDGRQPMGTAVWLTNDNGVDLVATTRRTQVFHPDGFEQLGIGLSDYRAVIVKSTQHFYAGFAPIAARVSYVSAPGAIPPDFANIPYVKFTAPYWPKVDDPF